MKKSLLDTDILSLFLRKDEKVVSNINSYLDLFKKITFSILTYYEILSGLKYRDNKNYLKRFLEFCGYSEIVPLTIESINASSEIYAKLRKSGITIDDVDILIAGTCVTNNFELITNNTKHFHKIKDLKFSNWA